MTEGRRIVAMGGRGFSARPGDRELDRYVIEQASVTNPRICLLPTASGDPDEQIQRFYRAFFELDCEPSHLSLFRLASHPVDIRARLLEQDVIYVGGGSMVNLLAIWRVHGLPEILSEAWHKGIVLCGISAGSMCWFTAGVTKSFGRPHLTEGLGLLPDSNSVHWHSEPERRPCFRDAIARGQAQPGWGVDDGGALFFAGTEMVEAVSARPDAGACRVDVTETGEVVEEPVETIALEKPRGAEAALIAIEEYRQARRSARG